jgi:hypothetical protein
MLRVGRHFAGSITRLKDAEQVQKISQAKAEPEDRGKEVTEDDEDK